MITYQQYLMQKVNYINTLLCFMPFVKKWHYEILEEIKRTRDEIKHIEEMTRTERQQPIKQLTITIESQLNIT